MAMPNNFVTIGELWSRGCDLEEDAAVFSRVKALIEDTLPEGWREWTVIDWTRDDLFGKRMDHKVLNKIRFALPSLELVKAFTPEAKSVGEKSYKNMKLRLLDWDICRALIVSPIQIAAKLRGSSAQAELFNKAVEPIKSTIISRQQIAEALSTDVETHDSRRRKRHFSESSSSEEEPLARRKLPKRKKRRLSSSSSDVNPTEARLSHMEGMIENLFHLVSGNKENEDTSTNVSWQAPTIGDELNDDPGAFCIENDWDTFSPVTREIEPVIPRADRVIEQQGLKCQRLGENSWNKIRYVDAQKKLQASPIFSTLKINSSLYNAYQPQSNSMKDILSKNDLAFGTIIHGLLKQRSNIQVALKEAADKHPEAAESLKSILAGGSEFRTTSDDLLQYACGKRSEVIEARRKLYEPKSSYYRSVLNEIPPSSTHLWDEDQLKEAIKAHGIAKIAPFRRSYTGTLERTTVKPKMPQGTPHDRKSRQSPFKKFKRTEYKHRSTSSAKDYKRYTRQLMNYVPCWRRMGAPESIINILKGYVIPFSEKPPITRLCQNTVAKFETPESPQMNEEMRKLIDQKVVVKLQAETGFLSKMFLTPKSEGKWRPVFNLKRLNKYVAPKKFRLLNHRKLPLFLQERDYMLCTSSVCKDHELGCKSTKGEKYTNSRISRRLLSRKSKPERVRKRGTVSSEYSYEIGFPGEPHQISNDAHAEPGLLGHYMEYRKELEKSTGGQNLQTEEITSNSDPERELELETGQVIVGKNGIRLLRHTTRAVSLQENTKGSESHSRTSEDAVPHKPRGNQRFKVVERKPCVSFHDLGERTRSAYDNRRFKYGLGSTTRRLTDKRRLGRTPKSVAYKQKRPPIQRERSARLALAKGNPAMSVQEVGDTLHRPVCNSEFSGSSQIRHTISMRQRRIRKCIYQTVGIQTSLGVPSAPVDPEGSPTPQQLPRSLHLDSSKMGESVLAPCPEEEGNRTTVHNPESRTSPDRSPNQQTSSQGVRFTPGGMEGTGWSDIVMNWSECERRVLEASWRKSTLKTYSAAWNTWRSWADKQGIIAKTPSPADVARYLCFLHNTRKFALSTILLHKSTIATFSRPPYAETISSNPLVKQILKGIANAKPKAARSKIWDINKLLSWMNENPPDTNSQFQVSRHVALLLLLSSGRRVHDLTLLRTDPGFFEQTEEHIIFWPQHGSKTDKHNYVQSGWKFLKNRDDLWDVVRWTTKYIDISAGRRGPVGQLIPYLFVTTRGKIGPASRSVIAGWVRTALVSAGIEGGAGSTRSAVATSRYNENVPLEDILKKGNWKGPGNFFRHYYKNVERSSTPSGNAKRILDSFVPI
nr:unnamed protein product [Callosobruchus chinensis]